MTTPAQAPPVYQTFKRQVQVPVGQHLAFAAGKGYYASPGAPAPAPAAAVASAADPYAAIVAGLPKPLNPAQITARLGGLPAPFTAAEMASQLAGLPSPFTSEQIAAQLGGMAQPLTSAQITSQANGEISPLVAAVTAEIGRQNASATHAISGFTGDAAAKLAALDYAAPYTQGEQGQSAVDAALRQSLAGAGSQGADQLAQRLGVINDPTVGAAAGALAANGAASGNTQLAQGSASLGEMLANAASAGSYGQKQPGITRLAGLQQIATAGQQAQAQIALQSQQLEAQLPSIIQNLQAESDARSQAIQSAQQNLQSQNDSRSQALYTAQQNQQAENDARSGAITAARTNLLGENTSRSTALTAARENQIARQDALASGTAANATKVGIANASNAEKVALANASNATKVGIANASNATKSAIATVQAAGKASTAAATQARSDRSYRLQFAKTFGFDPVTNATLPGYKRDASGSVVKVGAGKPGSGGSALTPNEITKNVQAWHDGKVQNARVPATDANGKAVYDANGAQVYTTKSGTTGALTYTQALKRLVAAKVDQQTALNYLDSAWKRGEGGRAWLMNPEQATLRQAGLPPRARMINGHAVLDGHQVAALKAAGHLPPGQETAEGYYVIAQVY